MKTFIITIEIEHTDKSFEREDIQEFIKNIGSPEVNFVKTMKTAFKDTVLGKDSFGIRITYALKE